MRNQQLKVGGASGLSGVLLLRPVAVPWSRLAACRCPTTRSQTETGSSPSSHWWWCWTTCCGSPRGSPRSGLRREPVRSLFTAANDVPPPALEVHLSMRLRRVTCQEGEVCRTGDGEVRGSHVLGLDSILGHLVEVWRVHVAVVVPPETVEGDEQHFLPLFGHRDAEDAGGPEDAETRGPQHDERFADLIRSRLGWCFNSHEIPPPFSSLKAPSPEQSFPNLSYRID